MSYFVLLGILIHKNEDDNAYLFKHEDHFSTISPTTMASYTKEKVDIDNRLALFCSVFHTWFYYAHDPDDDFKIPFREVYEHV